MSSVSHASHPSQLGQVPDQAGAKSWLPKGALEDQTLTKALEETVSKWAQTWFPRGQSELITAYIGKSEEMTQHGLGMGWRSGVSHELFLTMSNSGRRQIAGKLLDTDVSKHRLTLPDIEVIGKLTSPVINDLITRLGSYLDFPANPQIISAVAFANEVAGGFEQFTITLNRSMSVVTFYVRRDVAFAARRRLALPLRAPPPLSPKLAAIERVDVAIGARIGIAELNYADLSNLGIGDILVLDRGVEEDLEITINQEICWNTKCEIREDNGTTNLRLTQSN